MIWRLQIKCYATIFFAVALLVWVISMIACGGPAYVNCQSQDDDDNSHKSSKSNDDTTNKTTTTK